MDPMDTKTIEQFEARCAKRLADIGDLRAYAPRNEKAMSVESAQEIAHKQKLEVWEMGNLLRAARRGPLPMDKAHRFVELAANLPLLPVEEVEEAKEQTEEAESLDLNAVSNQKEGLLLLRTKTDETERIAETEEKAVSSDEMERSS